MRKAMRVIKEAHNIERNMRQTGKKNMNEEARKRTPQTKALIAIEKKGQLSKNEK